MPNAHAEPVALDASLHLLADHLLDALDEGSVRPSLVRVHTPNAAGFDLELARLEGRHPTHVILGTTAPHHIHAVGLVVEGWAYPAHLLGTTHPVERTRVSVVTMLTRSGETIHRLRHHGEATKPEPSTGIGGEQIDLLRRSLGLPTDPPSQPLDALRASRWVEAVLADRPTSEAGALALLAATGIEATARSWADHRSDVTHGVAFEADLDADDAGWLDDGAFSRFLLSRSRPVDALLTSIDEVCNTVVGSCVHRTLATWLPVDAARPDGPPPPHAA